MELQNSMEAILAPSLLQQQQQILSTVNSTQATINSLTIKLFGDATVENERGRFPQLEKAVERLEANVQAQFKALEGRVETLERQLIRYTAMASVIGAIGS